MICNYTGIVTRILRPTLSYGFYVTTYFCIYKRATGVINFLPSGDRRMRRIHETLYYLANMINDRFTVA